MDIIDKYWKIIVILILGTILIPVLPVLKIPLMVAGIAAILIFAATELIGNRKIDIDGDDIVIRRRKKLNSAEELLKKHREEMNKDQNN